MLIKKPENIKPSEITEEKDYANRRQFIKKSIYIGAAGLTIANIPSLLFSKPNNNDTSSLDYTKNAIFSTDEDLTSYKNITTYNNFYEFGTNKSDPSEKSGDFKTRPWSITVEGECNKPGTYDLDDIIKPSQFEERIYRFRCVEAWSMVIPWLGIPLSKILKKFEPNSKAKYVSFTTVYRPSEMPGQKRKVLNWPYIEGLRIDEAMHPLTILSVGLYGKELLNQNGAPIRLVIPWKYGFKSIKSIVKIEFSEKQPESSWNIAAPSLYGFYSNVNPDTKHLRWSQKKERRIGKFKKIKTSLFNGYGEQVAKLYSNMDLNKNY